MKRSRRRFGMLLLAVGITFFFEGIAQPGELQRLIGTVLVSATFLLALHAGEESQERLRLASTVVVILVVAVVVASAAGDERTAAAVAALASALLVLLAPPAVAIGVLRNLRKTGTVTLTVVAGVLSLYLLAGLFFAFLYTAIQNLDTTPFFADGNTATSSRSVYFSFVTLATLGYGDYTASSNLGHTLSITEALLGQLYLVTVVAAIVSRLAPRVRGTSESS